MTETRTICDVFGCNETGYLFHFYVGDNIFNGVDYDTETINRDLCPNHAIIMFKHTLKFTDKELKAKYLKIFEYKKGI